MQDIQVDLMAQLKSHLPVDQRRLRLISELLVALIKLQDACLSGWSRALNRPVSQQARYKQLQRFMRYFRFSQRLYAQLIWQRYGQGQQVVLTLDRTEWFMRGQWVQVLMLGIAHQGMSIPLLWQTHNRRGNSPVATRNALLRAFSQWLPISSEQQIWWTADREFGGKDWFKRLTHSKMHFCIRLKRNETVGPKGHTKRLHQLFETPRWRVLRQARWVKGQWLYLSGCRLANGDYVVLGSATPRQGLAWLYRQRWQIETLFGAFKSRGFDLTQCRINQPARLQTLLFVLALASTWAVEVGQWLIEQGVPLRLIWVEQQQRKAKSLFRHGLDHLQQVALHGWDYKALIQLLSCT